MSWLAFAYAVLAVLGGFFAGYYFVVSFLLRKQVIDLLGKLETAYEMANFLESLSESSEESLDLQG